VTGDGEARAGLREMLADQFRAAGLDDEQVERAVGAVLGMVDTVYVERGTKVFGEWTRLPDEIPAHLERIVVFLEPIERCTDG